MSKYYAVAALLWVLLAVLGLTLLVLLFSPGRDLKGSERAISAAVVLLLATPLALQLRSLHSRMGEMGRNFLVLDENGLRARLGGAYRADKGLPDIPETQLRWSEVSAVKCERRKFLYRSAIPFQYPLDVFTIESARVAIPFTVECVPGARRAAQKIAERIGVRLPDGQRNPGREAGLR